MAWSGERGHAYAIRNLPGQRGLGDGIFLKSLKADSYGNVVLLLSTPRTLFPVENAAQTSLKGSSNLYLCKISSDGARSIYGAYLGGSGFDTPQDLALDGRGAVYVLSFAASPDFPATPGAAASSAISRAFVTKLAPNGALEYSASLEYGLIAPALRVDPQGAVLLNVNNSVLRLAPDGGVFQRIATKPPNPSYWPTLLAPPDNSPTSSCFLTIWWAAWRLLPTESHKDRCAEGLRLRSAWSGAATTWTARGVSAPTVRICRCPSTNYWWPIT